MRMMEATRGPFRVVAGRNGLEMLALTQKPKERKDSE